MKSSAAEPGPLIAWDTGMLAVLLALQDSGKIKICTEKVERNISKREMIQNSAARNLHPVAGRGSSYLSGKLAKPFVGDLNTCRFTVEEWSPVRWRYGDALVLLDMDL
jgi:hypothetical protein